MSRREYDFETSAVATSLDPLMKAINEQKANYGGSNYYIELARKFDNSNYQWVIYRSSISSNCWDVLTSGYFVLFRINNMGTSSASAEVVKSMSFSGLYLSQGISQCVTTCTSSSGTSVAANTYIHAYLFVPVSTTQYKTAYLRTYGVELNTYTDGGKVISTSDISLKNTTATTIGNYVNNNPFIRKVSTLGTNMYMQWHNSANSGSVQGPVVVTITITGIYSTSAAVGTTVTGPSASTGVRCQLLFYSSNYYWITWVPNWGGNNTSNTMGLTANRSTTGWSMSTTYVEPFNTKYYKCYYFPIWQWQVPTSNSTTYITQNNNCLWWMTKDGDYYAYLERKFMMSSMSSLTPDSSAENIDYYRIGNGQTYNNYPSMFGLMTIDGRIIYTMNVNTKLLEKIDTKVR